MTKEKLSLNGLADIIHLNAKNKGFYDSPKELGTMLMLVVSELGEALEADRLGRKADVNIYNKMVDGLKDCKIDDVRTELSNQYFIQFVKDSIEDEIADSLIRLLDMCGYLNIDIDTHIALKMSYNSSRQKLHGKSY